MKKANSTIAARKQREKEDMRTLILDAARSIFLEKGYDQSSLRNIAERIQYSPGTIYLYFKDKDEIFFALHEEGFRRMLGKMQPLVHVADPFERLKAIGRVYIEFASENKDFYDLMFIIHSPVHNQENDEKWAMGQRTLDFLKDIIRQCQMEGRFAGRDVESLSFAIWSVVHGMSALYCRDRCTPYKNVDTKTLMEDAYGHFVAMLEKL